MMREIQKEFPQLEFLRSGERIVYLDSAATTLKPRSVSEVVREHLSLGSANVHRGAHYFSDRATEGFENVREQVRELLNARSTSEIIFTSGTTAGLNLIAYSLARKILKAGDEVLLTQMEHHSNIVPWQMIAKEKNATVKFAPVGDDGTLDVEAFHSLLSPKTKLVAVTQLSNALGVWNSLKPLIAEAKKFGAYTVVDAAQSVSSRDVNVQDLDCDFLVFSGHKLFGPTGVGVLYGKEEVLKDMPPFLGGGSMIATVTESDVSFLPPPHRFEAGTPPIAEVLGLGEALRFYRSLDAGRLREHDQRLLKHAETEIENLGGFRVLGLKADRSHILSFYADGAHPSDVGAVLNEQGIAVRAGHHCCMPLMARLQIPGTVRASFSIYSTEEDVNRLIAGLKKVKGLLL